MHAIRVYLKCEKPKDQSGDPKMPKTHFEKKTAQIVVRLPEDLKERIQKLAEKRKITPGEAVRRSIQYFLDKN